MLMSINSNALDFTGMDGAVYKNASVLKVMPDGIVVNYVDSNGFEDLRKVNIKQLPDDIKKQYNLNAQTATVFDGQRSVAISAIDAQKAKDTKEYYAEQKKEVENFTKVTNYLRTNEIDIIFNSITQVDFGSIGYAYSSDDYDKDAPFGLICLLGKSIEPKQDWMGKVYPLNKNTTYQTPFSTQPIGNTVTDEQSSINTDQSKNMNPQAIQKEKIPCYADYQTALDYFSEHPEAISTPSDTNDGLQDTTEVQAIGK